MQEKKGRVRYKAARRIAWSNRLWLAGKVVRDTLILAANFWYDFVRVWRYSSAVWTGNNRRKLAALVTMATHGVEKGLSLPAPRPGFGKELIQLLLCRMELYLFSFGPDGATQAAADALRAYRDFNAQHGLSDPGLAARIAELEAMGPPRAKNCSPELGGYSVIRKEQLLEEARIDLTRLFCIPTQRPGVFGPAGGHTRH
jgi:hypothetical protein